MNDRAVNLLEQYDIEVLKTRKGRGAILCDTPSGCLIFKEYSGNDNKIRIQNRVLEHIQENGQVDVEQLIPTKEEELSVRDGDGTVYLLKTYREGRECNIYDRGECLEAVRLLAKLHLSMRFPEETSWLPPTSSPGKDYAKHNRELRRVRKYLQKKSQKTAFEISLLNAFDPFLEQALRVTKEWEQYEGSKEIRPGVCTFCHGDYQYHNILFCEGGWFLTNFEKCIPDSPVRDLYLLMRKLLEKSGWSVTLGRDLLAAYERVAPLPAADRMDLRYRLAYPEKFWKIVNFYYNSGKAWIPERNGEKLGRLMSQEWEKQQFLDQVFPGI